MKTITTGLLALSVLLLNTVALAENATRTGGYTIHHNALTTDNLPAQVATTYGIPRSKNRALLNLSVIRDEPGTRWARPSRPKSGRSRATCSARYVYSNCAKSSRTRRSTTSPTFRSRTARTLNFEFEIMPEGGRYPLQANMRHEFWTN
jgi:hypothetical protein